MIRHSFKTKLWKYPGPGGWCFLTLPKALAGKLRRTAIGPRRGFGSLRVEVSIGNSKWRTSVFPDSKSKSYVLPVKASVRLKENLKEGRIVQAALVLIWKAGA
ncbi:MAG: DUF1905 domain-containing protein [Spirochaetia bacterium]|nr:DUF1905 domain-containing protein [Spirochaetia bacterium]